MLGSKNGYDVFLGGTVNNSSWRQEFLRLLETYGGKKIKCFNPVVEHWTRECIDLENFVKYHARYHIYVLTPKMRGVYTIAEMVESVHNREKKTFFYISHTDVDSNGSTLHWEQHMLNSLNAVANLLMEHGATKAISLKDLADKLIQDFTSTPVPRKM